MIDVDEARLYVSRTGADRAPVVLLHGLTDDGDCWNRVADVLTDAFTLIIPDARGHGRSSGIARGFTVQRLAADVVAVLDDMGVREASLFGHSMGAITAATVAADRPDLVRALVLEDPPLDLAVVPADIRRAAMVAEIEPWRVIDRETRHARAREVHPDWDPSETNPWADAKAAVDPTVVDHLDLFDELDWRHIFDRLACPGLLVTGDQAQGAIVSEAVATEALDFWRSGTRLHVPGAGHCVHRDRWSGAIGPIRSFLLAASQADPI
jgi:N-formylmaleamate deformylase